MAAVKIIAEQYGRLHGRGPPTSELKKARPFIFDTPTRRRLKIKHSGSDIKSR